MVKIIAIMAAVLLLDQGTKYLISSSLTLYQSIPLVPDIFHITYIHNYGAAFGILQNQKILFVILTIVIIIGLLVYYFKFTSRQKMVTWGISLLLGGALGNLVNRLFLGYVVDFLDFRIWPIFNVADIAVVLGAGLLILDMFLSDRKKDRELKQ